MSSIDISIDIACTNSYFGRNILILSYLILSYLILSYAPPNVNMILTAKVNQGTGKKHFLVEVEDGEVESTDADDGSEENVAS